VKLPTLITQQRIGFFAAGLLFSLATFYIGFRWPEIYERVFHEGFNYASQPTWYRIAGAIIGYLPAISIAVMALLRVRYERAVKPISYSVGVGAFYAGLFVLLVYAEGHSPF
jgi:hypothetical protein